MTPLHQVQLLIAGMTRAEKVAVLQSVVQDLGDAFPEIESRPGVCGGEPCIVRTRIPAAIAPFRDDLKRQMVRVNRGA